MGTAEREKSKELYLLHASTYISLNVALFFAEVSVNTPDSVAVLKLPPVKVFNPAALRS